MIGPLYSITEAAQILNVPRTWLRDKVTARAVPHTRLGRHVRFTEAHLAEIIDDGQQRPGPTGDERRGPGAGGRSQALVADAELLELERRVGLCVCGPGEVALPSPASALGRSPNIPRARN
jgi:excisionase family DNA binding protein